MMNCVKFSWKGRDIGSNQKISESLSLSGQHQSLLLFIVYDKEYSSCSLILFTIVFDKQNEIANSPQ